MLPPLHVRLHSFILTNADEGFLCIEQASHSPQLPAGPTIEDAKKLLLTVAKPLLLSLASWPEPLSDSTNQANEPEQLPPQGPSQTALGSNGDSSTGGGAGGEDGASNGNGMGIDASEPGAWLDKDGNEQQGGLFEIPWDVPLSSAPQELLHIRVHVL